MPRWDVGELPEPPRFTWKNLPQFIGPGLMMGGAAIGGGEWLMGPIVTARFGGGMLWLATLSVLAQVLYNIEISRYTLYTGEPIFNGKFRTLPGPLFWMSAYVLFDIGSIFPYLAANASTPLAAVWMGRIPGKADGELLRWLSIGIFLVGMLPLFFGGKILNSLKAIMSFKAFFVLGFLTLLAIGYSHRATWVEIICGFFQFGNLPVGKTTTENFLVKLFSGEALPMIDMETMPFLSAMVGIAGQGGLSNAPLSNYTRDQGWGMGKHVGAIPSLVGGYDIQLSHVGRVFLISRESLARWKRWYQHILRDQLFVWMPACFIGLALPSMLSVEFLPRGIILKDDWATAGMTADAVRDRVGGSFGGICWLVILFCGFLVLAPTVCGTADGFIRRWVDVFWSASRRLRALGPEKIKNVYFSVLGLYVAFGVVFLIIGNPLALIKVATSIFNFALGISCWHVVAINTYLLPKELRPNWFIRIGLIVSGLFFWSMAIPAAVKTYQDLTRPAATVPPVQAAPQNVPAPPAGKEVPAQPATTPGEKKSARLRPTFLQGAERALFVNAPVAWPRAPVSSCGSFRAAPPRLVAPIATNRPRC